MPHLQVKLRDGFTWPGAFPFLTPFLLHTLLIPSLEWASLDWPTLSTKYSYWGSDALCHVSKEKVTALGRQVDPIQPEHVGEPIINAGIGDDGPLMPTDNFTQLPV